jgi:hypothetical protein
MEMAIIIIVAVLMGIALAGALAGVFGRLEAD